MQTVIPQSVKSLLWDIDPDNISVIDSYRFVIERILEYGDFPEIGWMETTFTQAQIEDTLKTSRRISAKSGNFFAIKYQLPKETLLCIQQPFINKQDRF